MKQKIYSILLTGLFGLLGMNAWAQDLNITTIDGKEYYEIGSADDLVALATLVNGGETDANAILTADIDMAGLESWTAIGDWHTNNAESGYIGHFNGQGHKITGFNFSATHNYYGLFGVILGTALVENFTIEGNITINSNIGYAAGAVAYTNNTPTVRNVHSKVNISSTSTASTPRIGGVVGGCPAQSSTTTIDRCTYSGTLNANEKGGNYGGIVGYILNNNTTKVNITNCLFDGKLQGSVNDNKAQLGGIIGYTRKGIVSVKNCLSVGTFEYKSGNAMNIGQFVGRITYDNGNTGLTFENNYYQNTGIPVAGTSGGAGEGTAPVEVTEAQLASGEVCFALNGEQSENVNWFQSLKKTFLAEHYVITVNGGERATQTADVILEEQDDNTYKFILPNFVLHTNSADIPVGDVVLEGVTVNDDGTFSKTGQFNVPDENIPSGMSALKPYLQNIDYTLSGKVNGKGKRLYANIEGINVDLPVLGPYAISVEVGTDDFEPKAPTGEPYPTPYGTDIIYATGHKHCDGSAYPDTAYSNEDLGTTTDDHDFVDGFCSFCGTIDETWMTANADGYFEIANEKQLVWFAAYVNEVNAAAKGTLTDNIALTKAWTNPIGNASVAYTGKFDGQGKAITGFDQTATTTHNGLFGNINGATVQNFSISGSLTSDKNYCGVIGFSKGSSKIKGIHSSLNLDIQFKGWAGGVVGGADGYIVIEECSFDGTLNTHNFDDSKGGILGYANGATIKNCLFSGTIVGEAKQHYGGILGYVNNNAFGGVQNCLSIGSVTTTNTSHNGVAAIIGNMNTSTKVDGIFNNYWLTGSSYAGNNGAKAPDAEAPFEVTAEQLASGEVAYKLGAAWSQLLGTDNTPVLGTDAPVFYVGAAGYATLYDTTSEWALNGDATAYIGTAHDTYMHLTAIDDIPISTPVILKGTYYNKLATTATSDVTGNDLLGTDTEIEADGTMYVLAKPEDKEIGFYKATGTIPAGKAYYKSTSGVKAFTFTDDDATGIADLNNLKDTKDLIYNVAGQRLNKMQKGINIVGGKKVLH